MVILGVAAGAFLLYQNSNKDNYAAKKEVSCEDLKATARELVSQSKYKAAEDQVKAASPSCELSKIISTPEESLKAESKVESIKNDRDLAVKAFEAGDTKQAKVHADQAAATRRNMTEAEFTQISGQIPELNSALSDIREIQNDSYTAKPKFTETTEKTWE